VLLVLAAGGSNERDLVYYTGVAVIAGWSLWSIRPRRYSPLIWAGVFVSVAGVGLLAHVALNNFQHWLVDAAVDLLSGSRTDPYKHTTDLGHIGTLKLSDEILMRVDPGENLDIPLLLHRASYNHYREKTWVARRAPLQAVGPAPVSGNWTLAESQVAGGQVSVITQLNDGLGVLALPTGSSEMNNLSIIEMKRNRLGTFRVVGDAGLMRYTALVDSEVSLPGAPDEDDLVIAPAESEVIHQIADQLGLKGQSPTAAIASLEAYFKSQYRYSLYQQGSLLRTPLSHFLTTSHAGHCEYFATATTLLLRAAGIPTRYATGFSVQEYSQLEGVYLVRLRHAHSWARAYVDGKWQDIDNTPPSWLAVEEQTASILEPLVDLFSWLWHRFSVWRLDSQRGGQQWVLLLSLPVIGYLLWRMRGQRKRTALEKPQQSAANEQTWQGMDSDLFRIEALLEARGFGRHAGETSFAWARRLADTERQFDSLLRLVELHYQKRFGDRELSPDDRSRFADLIADWLAEPGTSVLSEP
jgi:transglutaminase-like putative cysteine protease